MYWESRKRAPIIVSWSLEFVRKVRLIFYRVVGEKVDKQEPVHLVVVQRTVPLEAVFF
jgi:hypothetical protein